MKRKKENRKFVSRDGEKERERNLGLLLTENYEEVTIKISAIHSLELMVIRVARIYIITQIK